MSDYPMLISNKLHSFRNFYVQKYKKNIGTNTNCPDIIMLTVIMYMYVFC